MLQNTFFCSSFFIINAVFLFTKVWVTNLRIVTGEAKHKSLLAELCHLAKEEGIGHLWTGTGTSVLLVSNPVIQFFTYEQLKAAILASVEKQAHIATTTKHSLSPIEAFGVGAISKAIATVLTYPLQLTQSVLRLQHKSQEGMQETTHYKSTLDCLINLYRRDGIEGLFTGMRAKLLQTVLTAAFTFLTYEQILNAVHTTHLTLMTKHRINKVKSL